MTLKGILGKKITQTQRFLENGRRIPVTIIEAGPCPVVQVKTSKEDDYSAVQLGFGQRKKTNKPIAGHAEKAQLKTIPRYLKEIRVKEETEQLKPGDLVRVGDIFQAGEKVQVKGISKGKGFAGVVKRWGFAGGPRTHGQSDRERAPGSIGQTTTPGRVYKGKKMAGRMGGARVSIRNLEVIDVDSEKNLLVLKGLVPGAKSSPLLIRKMG